MGDTPRTDGAVMIVECAGRSEEIEPETVPNPRLFADVTPAIRDAYMAGYRESKADAIAAIEREQ